MHNRAKKVIVTCALLGVFAICTSLLLQGDGRDLKIRIRPEVKILPEGLQPFMFLSRQGTLVVQAQLPTTEDKEFPGRWGTVRSTDGGRSWQTWATAKEQGNGPFIEGSVGQL